MSRYFYSVFGSRLRSAIPFPELRPVEPGPVRWSFELSKDLSEPEDMELLGSESLYGDVIARLYRHSTGHRITVGDTGSYDLLHGGSRILWKPNSDPWWDFGRGHLLGRVLATSLQLEGTVTLHGSAVEMGDGVVGFLAPKHFGKSTLAMMLYNAGARFVSDDSLPLAVRPNVLAFPGIHSLRMRLGNQEVRTEAGYWKGGIAGRDGKVTLPPLPEHRVLLEPAPISALYFLAPRPAEQGGVPIQRVLVPRLAAAMGLVGQMKIGAMLGGRFAADILESAAAVVSSVPVYQLAIVRDITRLPAVVDQLVDWHGLIVPAPTCGGG